MPSLIPEPAAIEARLAELKEEASELRAQLKLSKRAELRRNGGAAKPDETEVDGALPFMTEPASPAASPSTDSKDIKT